MRCLGRTESDRKITNEPWSSMKRSKRTNKTTHRSEWRSLLKKDLTGPTLLEMYGNRVNRDLEISSEGYPVEDIYSAVGILTLGISIVPDHVRSLRASMENL